ncbi:chromate efflux transporter [Thalassotalea sp. G2M2-11]|uniref:chromate efflux transporter n=1 Tax=Thalassotalea sp. G2M2-11 TaxID=2787627 RepID=UPI0019D26CE2
MVSIFKHFFWLGCISFGGPAAHIGYFHQKFIQQLKWFSQEEYGQIVALSQFLPGPGSSQVGFALGYKKAGLAGALTAFFAFTLPSVILMILLASLSYQLVDNTYFYAITHGLKLLAVVVVADAVFSMYQSFCRDKITRAIAIFSAMVLLLFGGILMQMLVLVAAAFIGIKYLTNQEIISPSKIQIAWLPLIGFITLLVLLPSLAQVSSQWQLASDFYQAGSLVFGGGHVVLPLLQNLLAHSISTDTFLTGYAAAQAVPGPMFTLATFLGFHLSPSFPVLGALIATLAIFLPGFLLMLTFLKHWQGIAQIPRLAGAIQAVNAAVVGLLLSALYVPVFQSAVVNQVDMAIVIVGLFLLKQYKTPMVVLVLGFALAGLLVKFT